MQQIEHVEHESHCAGEDLPTANKHENTPTLLATM